MMRFARFGVLVSLCAVLGCAPAGPKVVPVSGSVTLDGKPVSGATVLLMPAAGAKGLFMGTAQTDAQGAFQIVSYLGPQELKGAVEGSYQIAVVHKKTSGILTEEGGLSGGVAPGGIQVEWLVPQQYSAPDTSGLTCDVKAGMAPLALSLKTQ